MAEQLEFFELQSPCRGICQTNEQGYCRGCYRTRDERFNWINYSDSQKRNLLRLCRQRFIRFTRQQIVEQNNDTQQQSLF
ncbi:DUF1289 domain-containing protein [Moellerella wisconsensis]|uniref:Putative oxidoreductase n=1 Tax=Moellerella wisconsensis ATCC 35017 TaxID=1354267 RepID=A0A0N0ZAG2_9GAMM|nr:DUF1289 domain-containing protein [Moellerella wisconsensis]KPD02444.1 putative oxidoreductase [Moellerella wisconsensis ATCC 35017]VFS53813.1 Predicted Fe-S protein [Moellerella wisconsensis]